MKKEIRCAGVAALLLLILGGFSVCFGLDITANDGTTYRHCEVTKVEPDSIVVTYADGLATIGYDNLPPNLQKQYFDASKVAAYRKQVADAAAKQAADEKQKQIKDKQEEINRANNEAIETKKQQGTEAVDNTTPKYEGTIALVGQWEPQVYTSGNNVDYAPTTFYSIVIFDSVYGRIWVNLNGATLIQEFKQLVAGKVKRIRIEGTFQHDRWGRLIDPPSGPTFNATSLVDADEYDKSVADEQEAKQRDEKLSKLGDKLHSGDLDFNDLAYYLKGLSKSKVKEILGPPDSATDEWTYYNKVHDPDTEKSTSLYVVFDDNDRVIRVYTLNKSQDKNFKTDSK